VGARTAAERAERDDADSPARDYCNDRDGPSKVAERRSRPEGEVLGGHDREQHGGAAGAFGQPFPPVPSVPGFYGGHARTTAAMLDCSTVRLSVN
jgi:hypothetical protein